MLGMSLNDSCYELTLEMNVLTESACVKDRLNNLRFSKFISM